MVKNILMNHKMASNKQIKSDWEKEWDKKFFKFYEIGAIENSDKMKQFIHQLLDDYKVKIMKIIEEMSDQLLKISGGGNGRRIFILAQEELRNKIRKLFEKML